VSEKRLQFGASPLYFGLRAFKALLHIAYKLESEEPLRTKQLLQKEQLLLKVPLSKSWDLRWITKVGFVVSQQCR